MGEKNLRPEFVKFPFFENFALIQSKISPWMEIISLGWRDKRERTGKRVDERK